MMMWAEGWNDRWLFFKKKKNKKEVSGLFKRSWKKGKKRTGNFGIDNGEQCLPSITSEKFFQRVSVVWMRMGSSSSAKDFLLLLYI